MSTSSRNNRGRSDRARPRRAALALSAMVFGVTVFACASVPDANRYTRILQPDAVQFQGPGNKGVSYFLERRCGTLDCHGQVGRPLRIYGRDGLRLPNDAGNTPVHGDTTLNEITANYEAVVALEPENMSRVVAGEYDPTVLMLMLKPLAYVPDTPTANGPGVRHKGGPVIAAGSSDPGYDCLYYWLKGQTHFDSCQKAAELLEH